MNIHFSLLAKLFINSSLPSSSAQYSHACVFLPHTSSPNLQSRSQLLLGVDQTSAEALYEQPSQQRFQSDPCSREQSTRVRERSDMCFAIPRKTARIRKCKTHTRARKRLPSEEQLYSAFLFAGEKGPFASVIRAILNIQRKEHRGIRVTECERNEMRVAG